MSLVDAFAEVPRGKYGAILGDPGWKWKSRSPTPQARSAGARYRVMDLAQIKALPVGEMAADDCVLFLWVLNSMLPQGLAVIDAWGFTYKTKAFTWAKRTKTGRAWHMGMGFWSRQNTEDCLLATRGHPKRLSKSVRQLIEAPLRRHSEKPDDTHPRIEALVKGPYLELFARSVWPGWDSAGDEIGYIPAEWVKAA